MTFQPGQSGNPLGAKRTKPFRDALIMEAKLLENGEDTPAPKGSIRYAARQQLLRACEDTQSFKEAADRLDGKVPQTISGDDDADPIRVISTVERTIVKASDSNG